MTLEFLTPAVTQGSPAPRSPFAGIAELAGAHLGVRDGWRVPTSFGTEAEERAAVEESVGFADASPLRVTEIQGARASEGLPLGTAQRRDGGWWCPITPTRVLIVGGPATGLDVTAQFCAIRVRGPLARPLMSRFCALDLRYHLAPPTSLRAGSVARTPGVVIVEESDQLLVLVGAALAEYMWTVVSDAAARLGGRPVGAQVMDAARRPLEEATAGA
jgi:glycine cleavage system aminomethyltransferase T